jgi:hypothetical protein
VDYKKEYVLKTRTKRNSKPYLLCEDENGDEALLPAMHTNFGKPRLSEDQQAGVPCFDYKDLVAVWEIIKRIKEVSR